MTKRHILLIALSASLLASCGMLEKITPTAAPPQAAAPAPDAVSGESDAERADEVAPEPDASGLLGTTIASLGDPSRSGSWLETPLVDAEAKGRVTYAGKSADVDLIPIPGEVGAGSRMSLAAFQALGASITDLPEVEVFRN